jgi:hypothetical protein
VDKPVLIIDLPELSDEAVVGVRDFLEALMESFDSHYFSQLQRYYRGLSDKEVMDILF